MKTLFAAVGMFLFLLSFGARVAVADEHAAHEGHTDQVAVAPVVPPPPEPMPPMPGMDGVPATTAPPTTPTTPAHVHPAAPASAQREEPRTAIDVPAIQQSRIGLMTAKLEMKQVSPTLRTVGVVQVDERRQAEVHSRVPGFIDELLVNAIGQSVRKGQVLYRIYSPEIVSTQEEYLAARGQGEIGKKVSKGALDRLSLWGVSPKDISDLEESGAVKRNLAVESPANGVVIEKMAVQGVYATPEMALFRIADLTKVWIVASLYETEVGLVKSGDPVNIELPSEPGKIIHATVSYVYPEMDVATRTGKARIDVNNADGALKPGMYATLTIAKDLGDVLVAPADAVIDTGARKIVFVRTGETRFEPRAVVLGPRVGEGFVVLSGVAAGDDVVVRASFLIDAESRLQAALKSGGAPTGHAGHAGHGG